MILIENETYKASKKHKDSRVRNIHEGYYIKVM